MTFYLLYILIDGQFTQEYPFHFAMHETCTTVGDKLVKDYKYEAFRCVKEVIE